MSRKTLFFILTTGVLVAGGWACGKFGGSGSAASISNSQVVATVGNKDITFGDWMRQVDLLRVMIPEGRGMDPNNAQQVTQALKTLISQQIVLTALRKANYTDPAFDQSVQKKLVQAELQLKEDKEQLEKDMQAVKRLEKTYKEPFKEYLLAQNFASSQRTTVIVTEKEIRDQYQVLAKRYKQAGQRVPPYNKEVQEYLKGLLQADKLMKSLQEGIKVDRKEEIIQKYLTSLSPSRTVLGSAASSEPVSAAGKDTQKK